MRSNYLETTICKGCSKLLRRDEAYISKKTGYIRESRCMDCRRLNYEKLRVRNNSRQPSLYRMHVGESCELCGFVGEKCQMDVDHVDGNRNNNVIDNLRTLCANCHRLATHGKI